MSSCNSIADISCTTFNILAPIYKRLSGESRESEFRDCWLSRNEDILDRLLNLRSSIICLQEFWIANKELVTMYRKRLNDAGYTTFELARTNNRGDGLLTAVRREQFEILSYKEILFNDIGDRIAQLLHIDLLTEFSRDHDSSLKKEALVVNTHLLFPHNSGCCFHRLQQVYKILQFLEAYSTENKLQQMPIILCGDWNGSKKGNVYKFLRSQGFASSYDIAHQYADSDASPHKWVSHRNHRGNICAVDFIWLLNPDNHRKRLEKSFMEAVLGNIKNHLNKASGGNTSELQLIKAKPNYNSYITYSQFYQALAELRLTSECPDGLSVGKIKDMWDSVDTERDGLVDLAQFDMVLNSPSYHQGDDDSKDANFQTEEALPYKSTVSTTIGFNIRNAVLFPPEVEQGKWPESYSLSDHAHLTVEFAPVMLFVT